MLLADPSLSYVVLKAMTFNGVKLNHGDVFDAEKLKCNERKLRQLYKVRMITSTYEFEQRKKRGGKTPSVAQTKPAETAPRRRRRTNR